jgi:proteic killer suppression protein
MIFVHDRKFSMLRYRSTVSWPARFANITAGALRKLAILNRADSLDDLSVPPGNRLEKLIGDRNGQYSIRINGQWRICFDFGTDRASNVEITDSH